MPRERVSDPANCVISTNQVGCPASATHEPTIGALLRLQMIQERQQHLRAIGSRPLGPHAGVEALARREDRLLHLIHRRC